MILSAERRRARIPILPGVRLHDERGLGMFTRRRVVLAIVAVGLAVGGAAGAVAATTGGGGGTAAALDFETGGRIDTPSGTFQEVTSKTFTAASGPIVVRFAGEGYEEDWNRNAVFVGRSYAAINPSHRTANAAHAANGCTVDTSSMRSHLPA